MGKSAYKFKADNGDYIAIKIHEKAPEGVLSPRDTIEIEVKNKKPINLFIRPDEALHIASGLFIALLKIMPDFIHEDDVADKNEK
ncbi:MAG: hypothetical protein NUV80_06070 [Candidatus Berkelbacteria bacterium]|nr:hypothetical protein [Candidatus Berkelbacteria bacterium]